MIGKFPEIIIFTARSMFWLHVCNANTESEGLNPISTNCCLFRSGRVSRNSRIGTTSDVLGGGCVIVIDVAVVSAGASVGVADVVVVLGHGLMRHPSGFCHVTELVPILL